MISGTTLAKLSTFYVPKAGRRATFGSGRNSAKFWRKGVVSEETVVLRRWESSIQKFGFIKGVDNVNWPPYRDSKS